MAVKDDQFYLGIDFGTSGARSCVIDQAGSIIESHKVEYDDNCPVDQAWDTALFSLLTTLDSDVKSKLTALAIDGTSATTLLLDANTGKILEPPQMYNSAQPADIVNLAKQLAPRGHTVTASTSTLCKVLTWHTQGAWQSREAQGMRPVILHQADWLASLLHGQRNVSDWNNALKLGFDPATEDYPDWLLNQEYYKLFPSKVLAPGAPIAPIMPSVAEKTGLAASAIVCAGTTDSNAAFLAAGVTEPGEAVTSLGSTMAIKMLSETRVDDASYGVYSHRIGNTWLVGGASNTGGVVLRKYFTSDQLQQLTPLMNPNQPTGLRYTVLPTTGERFPVNDPTLEPCLEPRPAEDAVFLQAMLEAMARTEGQAYRLLHQLGATPVKEVFTAGGGAANPVWTELREKELGVPVKASPQGEAAYGAALLAKSGVVAAAAAAAATT